MNTTSHIKKSISIGFLSNPTAKIVVLAILTLAIFQGGLLAQENNYTKPSWYFGAAAGANLNFYRGSTQHLDGDLTLPMAFHDGFGVGLFAAPLIEFYRPNSRWGFMFQTGYDNRSGTFETVYSPCNCPADLKTGLSYLTFEPSLRFAPFKSNFYLFAGPRIALNLTKTFQYQLHANPAYPDQLVQPKVEGDLSDVISTLYSMQIAMGYDIPLNSTNHRTQYIISPFVSYHPYFGQNPRSIETWNTTIVRVGAAFKFGRGTLIQEKSDTLISLPLNPIEPYFNDPIEAITVSEEGKLIVYSPENIPVERRVRETFPLRNYIFFDLESTEIPDRYVLIKKTQVGDFKESQLETFTPKKLSERSKREMIVYYNILNILGDRMQKVPSSTIILVGSSEKGPDDGLAMAESVRTYLTGVWGINASRIEIEGNYKPKIPSEQPGGTLELKLLREGDRRVSIESTSPALLMEFQTGPGAPLKPVEIIGLQEAPLDSYITFYVEKADELYISWSLEITDKRGVIQFFGPFTQNNISIPGKDILGTLPHGDFKIAMLGFAHNDSIVRKDTTVHMVRWTPPQNEEGMRFSVIFEINESKAIKMYDKYLTEVVTPKIPSKGKIIIHGYTDIIGDEKNNQRLSLARANEVKEIIEKALLTLGRKDVTFEVFGFGENATLAPFENDYPEERFYNRTVIIDIIPQKEPAK